MVEAALKQNGDVACLWFNGWAFQGFDDAKTVLIEATIAELVRQRSTVGKVKKLGASLINASIGSGWTRQGSSMAFALATGLPSPDLLASAADAIGKVAGNVASMDAADIEEQLAAASSYLKPAEGRRVSKEIHHFRAEFAELLEEAQIGQLVVLIDDLDRCLPATAIDTIEALRLFLFVPRTAFIIGADEGMIEYAVRQHFPGLPIVPARSRTPDIISKSSFRCRFAFRRLVCREVRVYVTLLLVEALVGEDHDGFAKLLVTARDRLNKPWLGAGLSPERDPGREPTRERELDVAFLLAQQIGPILAEGKQWESAPD